MDIHPHCYGHSNQDTDPHANSHLDPHRHSAAHSHPHSHSNPYQHTNGDSNWHIYTNRYTYGDCSCTFLLISTSRRQRLPPRYVGPVELGIRFVNSISKARGRQTRAF
jgi:hypothetical protein